MRSTGPALPGPNPLPGERADRHPEGDNERGHSQLEVADVVEEMGAKGPNLLRGPADVLRGKAEFLALLWTSAVRRAKR